MLWSLRPAAPGLPLTLLPSSLRAGPQVRTLALFRGMSLSLPRTVNPHCHVVSLSVLLPRVMLQATGSRLWSMLLEGLPSGARAGPVRLSAGNLTAALTRGYTSALDSPCDILLHDRAGLAASIRKPAVGSPYVYANAEAIAAIAEGSGDVQVCRAGERKRRCPHWPQHFAAAASRPRVHAPGQRPAPATLRHGIQRPDHALRVHTEPRRRPPRGCQGATL